ncbi:MAG: endo-1,4-beta-xylanase [Actinomycetota bacterium]
MEKHADLTRRSFLLGAAAAAAGVVGAASPTIRRAAAATTPQAIDPTACGALTRGDTTPLWEMAYPHGLVYGSSTTTWQLDPEYRRLFAREAAVLFTEDDLLWWRLKPTPESQLHFQHGDQIVDFAEKHGILMFGAHLVWDQGFGGGWTDADLWGLKPKAAHDLLFGVVRREVNRYKGRMAGWIVANEVVDWQGMRTDTPWADALGPGYVLEAFQTVRELEPNATLVINDFGFETDNEWGDLASDKRASMLNALDTLLGQGAPIDALGIQAHLAADGFADKFDTAAYRTFLSEVASRGVRILITEMDVLDDGLPAKIGPRDRGVADVYRRYLDVALEEPAVAALMTFGLSDRYTWLGEDYPRDDGANRRPLPFSRTLRTKPAYHALADALQAAPTREVLWEPPRCAAPTA